jgi:peptidoglycan/LPS O-acetylase OafA/YrhL
MVLIAHALFSYQGEHPVGWSYLGNGDLGVSIFFVISGFLITTLLLREFEKNGDISLRHFYFRRALPHFATVLHISFGGRDRLASGLEYLRLA